MAGDGHVLTVLGARPQFVKAAVVSRALADAGVEERLLHTGQHHDHELSGLFFDELGLPEPSHRLGVGSGSHGAQTGRMLEGIERVLVEERPRRVLVYGDTNSTLAGALAAAKLGIPVDHVEAGLRSSDRSMPEEINRVTTDHLASLLLAPCEAAVRNLACEGIHGERVIRTGDVMLDVAMAFRPIADRRSTIIADLDLDDVEFVLCTVHRASNTDDPERLAWIVDLVEALGRERPVVFPIHPRTLAAVAAIGLEDRLRSAVRVLPPQGYLDMVALESRSSLVVTDSGGVQREAFFHGIPSVVLRDRTEWTELVESGWCELVPPLGSRGLREVLAVTGRRGTDVSPYGRGDASRRIASAVLHALQRTD